MHIHDGRTRLLVKLIGLVLAGAALYFVLMYGILGASQKASVASTTPSMASSSAKVGTGVNTSLGSSATVPSQPTVPAPSNPTPPTNTPLVITNFQNNSTVTLTKGERFTVELGSGLNWTLSFDPTDIVEQTAGATSSSTQGTFEAKTSGRTTMSATGAPICKAGEACPMFLAVMKVTFVVK